MGERAECVMLNKGPYVVDAVRALDDILRRMENHQRKKRSMLRQLRLADHLSVHNSQALGSNAVVHHECSVEVVRTPTKQSNQ